MEAFFVSIDGNDYYISLFPQRLLLFNVLIKRLNKCIYTVLHVGKLYRTTPVNITGVSPVNLSHLLQAIQIHL